MTENREYLGDSVYVELEYGMLKLIVNNGVEDGDTIYLEPSVYAALVKYVERIENEILSDLGLKHNILEHSHYVSVITQLLKGGKLQPQEAIDKIEESFNMLNLIERARRKAKCTPCKYKVAAIGFDARGNHIATVTNKPRFSRPGGSIHAEMNLMSNYRVKTIHILRSNGKRIDPCPACAAKAEELGIKIIPIYWEE